MPGTGIRAQPGTHSDSDCTFPTVPASSISLRCPGYNQTVPCDVGSPLRFTPCLALGCNDVAVTASFPVCLARGPEQGLPPLLQAAGGLVSAPFLVVVLFFFKIEY